MNSFFMKIISAALIVLFSATSSFAFKKVPSSEVGTSTLLGVSKQADGAKVPTQTPQGKELGLSGDQSGDRKSGIDIWIPGLGVVGRMPKVDFGLELLYGDQNSASGADLQADKEIEEPHLLSS